MTSTSTRIPGLIAASDLTHRERLGTLAVPDPSARTAALQRRFEQLHETRRWAYVLLATLTIGAIAVALWRRTGFWARFCVAIAPVMVAVALLLSLGSAARSEVIVPVLGFGSIALAAALAVPRRLVLFLGPAVLLLFLVVLWAWPETAGFSAIGPRPEEGGRFYGVNNVVETVLLAISLFSAAELGLVSVLPIAALALVTVGWSRTGADGGGLIVFAAAFAFLALRLAGPITLKRLAVAGAAGRRARAGLHRRGRSERRSQPRDPRLREGPRRLVRRPGPPRPPLGRRPEQPHAALIMAASLVALVWVAFRRPRSPMLDALLLGLAVSLLVNDAPTDAASGGAISAFVLWTWTVTRYTRARALGDPDPGRGGPPGGRLR